ncbi:MAG: NADH-quinone oxidoreductase subunit NuoK [Gemmatimonadota bacterium]|jgi:NADH-quinone oxidoreductase subunit K|nr:NADH-quinone oxidoreductase subunit NuoK [Gemmatimonadota bacterium]MDP6802517.1 NADH-quinone oxidoreductase subunit NuoK [Gemmatimonadota bacterium]MDP7031780.1 NADH-quinone oxidoreductase subunit NuoK [Gemmatimonadota bacterium]
MIGLGHFLGISSMLFALGLTTIMIRRNAIALLMGIELMLNAAALNFVAFARFRPAGSEGDLVALFVVVVAVAEAAVALGIVLNMFRALRTARLDEVSELRG